MQKRTVFLMNRLHELINLCNTAPITFYFIEGSENPAGNITRPVSCKVLLKSNYFEGPSQFNSAQFSSYSARVFLLYSKKGSEVIAQTSLIQRLTAGLPLKLALNTW